MTDNLKDFENLLLECERNFRQLSRLWSERFKAGVASSVDMTDIMQPLREIHSNLVRAIRVLQPPITLPSLYYDVSPQPRGLITFKENYVGPGETCIDATTTDGRIIKIRSKSRAHRSSEEVPQSPSLGWPPLSPVTRSRQPCGTEGDTLADKQELLGGEEGNENEVIKKGEYIEANEVLRALRNVREHRQSEKAVSSEHYPSSSPAIQTSGSNERKPTRSIEFVGNGWVAGKGSLLGNFSSDGELMAAIDIVAEGRVPTPEGVAERARKHTREKYDMRR